MGRIRRFFDKNLRGRKRNVLSELFARLVVSSERTCMSKKLDSPKEIFQEVKRIASMMETVDKEIDESFESLANWVTNEDSDVPKGRRARTQRLLWDKIHELHRKKSELARQIWIQVTGENCEKLVFLEVHKPVIQNMPNRLLAAIKALGIVVTDGIIEDNMYIVFPPGSKEHKGPAKYGKKNSFITKIVLPSGKTVKFVENSAPGTIWDYLIL
jgi:hypothetical protein